MSQFPTRVNRFIWARTGSLVFSLATEQDSFFLFYTQNKCSRKVTEVTCEQERDMERACAASCARMNCLLVAAGGAANIHGQQVPVDKPC